MNHKIKQLYIQALDKDHEAQLEKFAHLLINTCAELAEDVQTSTRILDYFELGRVAKLQQLKQQVLQKYAKNV